MKLIAPFFIAGFLVVAAPPALPNSGGLADNGNQQKCYWYKQKARATGDKKWWDLWNLCIREMLPA